MNCLNRLKREYEKSVYWLTLLSLSSLAVWCSAARAGSSEPPAFIPPATPLVACDPYFSIWPTERNPTDTATTHWTGKQHRLASLIRIDGQTYRLMGNVPADTLSLRQVSLEITPTRSIYRFEGASLAVKLTFMTPALSEDIDLLSRPITYVSYEMKAIDEQLHEVAIFFSASGELTVNESQQLVDASTESFGDMAAIKFGSVDQPVLGRSGDDVRIDWGYLYLAAERDAIAARALGAPASFIAAFAAGEPVRENADELTNRPAGDSGRCNDFRCQVDQRRAGDMLAGPCVRRFVLH